MKKILLAFTLLSLIAFRLMASELPTADATTLANIYKGNTVVSGEVQFTQNNRGKVSTSNFDLGLSTMYFVVDKFALGAVINLFKDTDQDMVALLGPAAQYTFWQKDSLTSYLQLSYQKGLTEATVSGRFDLKIGAQYFITSSVAAGPYISYTKIFGRKSSDYDRYTFGAALGIYL